MAPRSGPGLTLRGARAPHLLLAAVGLLALGVRIVPVLRAGALTGWLSYDEGVHLAVAQRLLAGQMTYREVFFAHPPGVVLAQVPVALLAQGLGEPVALAVSRCVVMCLGAITAVLAARLLLPRGLLAAGTAGVVAALFAPAVAADRISMLEPALSLGLVVALTALASSSAVPRVSTSDRQVGASVDAHMPSGALTGRQRRALAVGGLALGLAMSVKVWAALDIGVLTVVVVVRYGWSAAVRWCVWAAAGLLLVVGPFAALAPGAMWRDVILAQVARARTGGLALNPLSIFESPSRDAGVVLLVVAVIASVLAAVVASVRGAPRAPAAWPDVAWWVVIGLVHLTALVLAPSHYFHYVAFLTVPTALVAGAAAGLLSRGAGARTRVVIGIAVAVVVVALASPLPALPDGARVDHSLLAAEAQRGCVWAREVEFLHLADAARDAFENGCPGRADLYGERMATSLADDPPAALDALDARVADELAASQVAFLRADAPFQGLGPRTREYLERNFEPGPTTGRVEVWRRTD